MLTQHDGCVTRHQPAAGAVLLPPLEPRGASHATATSNTRMSPTPCLPQSASAGGPRQDMNVHQACGPRRGGVHRTIMTRSPSTSRAAAREGPPAASTQTCAAGHVDGALIELSLRWSTPRAASARGPATAGSRSTGRGCVAGRKCVRALVVYGPSPRAQRVHGASITACS